MDLSPVAMNTNPPSDPPPDKSRRKSRNDLFTASFGSTGPNIALRSRPSSKERSPTQPRRESISRPLSATLPASDLLDLISAEIHSPKLSTSDLHLRLSLTDTYLLGTGKHSSVYLAAYTLGQGHRYALCAAKRINADQEAQQAALNEAYLLSKLRHCPHVVNLLSIKDESRPSDVAFLDESQQMVPSSYNLLAASTHTPEHLLRSPSQIQSVLSVKDRPVRRVVSLHQPSVTHSARDSGPNPGPKRNPEASVPRLILVQDLCAKGTLASYIRRHSYEIGRTVWLKWSKQIAKAVLACHQLSFLHADLKTQNVMLTESLDAKLVDFGGSFAILPGHSISPDLEIGTTVYNAPEVLRLSSNPETTDVGLAADIFSLGIVLNVMLTGREPYRHLRPVEQMLWASRGAYWDFEQTRRLSRFDSLALSSSRSNSRPNSLYSTSNTPDCSDSFESLLSTQARTGRISKEAVARLLQSGDVVSNLVPVESSLSSEDPDDRLPDVRFRDDRPSTLQSVPFQMQAYSDGSPLQYFLSGPSDVVPEGILRLLQRMTSPEPSARPTIQEVVNSLEVF